MTSHTPGPWFVIDRVTSLDITLKEETATRQYPGSFIRVDPNHYIDVGISQTRANARLIAAAPDLLEALVAAVECGMVPISSAQDGGASKYSKQVEVADQVRAAIAKATGAPK